MSLNEEITKSVSNKFSPYGNPINKKLLTPCRQVGLSRKRKTPSSITKGFLTSPIESNTPASNNTTPLNHMKTRTLETRNLTFNSPVIREEQVVIKHAVKSGHNKSAKKTLIQVFSGDLFNESKVHDTANEDLANVLHVPVENDTYNVNKNVCNELTKVDSNVNYDDVDKNVPHNVNKSVSKLSNMKSNINYDTNDDFMDKNCEKNKIKTKRKLSNDIEEKPKTLKTENSDNKLAVDLKKCQIAIQKLSEAEIDVNVFKTNIQKNKIQKSSYISDDDDFVVVKRKKVNSILSDDSDFQCTPPEILENSSVVKLKTTAIVHTSDEDLSTQSVEEKENKMRKFNTKMEKLFNGKSKNFVKSVDQKILNILDDDDDFTSTPEREKHEKIKLIEKIKSFENQLKHNRKKWEDLQQAAIYKSKHNIKELQSLTEKWRQGCILGLNALLANLQQHGPMDMVTLLHNLHIPLDIAKSKIKINPEI